MLISIFSSLGSMKLTMFIVMVLLICCGVRADGIDKYISFSAAEYPPYYGEKLKNYGPVTEIIVEAYVKVGYKVTVTFYPWVRAEMLAKNGVHDGMFPPWYSKEREAYFAFSEPLFANELSFFSRKGMNIAFTSYDDLKTYQIGTVRGYVSPKGFTKANFQIEEVSTDLQNLIKLALGRIDLAIVDKKIAQFLLQTEIPEYADKLNRLEPMLESKMQYLCLSKKTENYQKKLDDFNRGLELLRESGEYDQILLKHGF